MTTPDATKTETGCNCIAQANEALGETHPGVKVLVDLFSGRAVIATYREYGRKMPTLFATHCPFCGIKYTSAEPSPATAERGERR